MTTTPNTSYHANIMLTIRIMDEADTQQYDHKVIKYLANYANLAEYLVDYEKSYCPFQDCYFIELKFNNLENYKTYLKILNNIEFQFKIIENKQHYTHKDIYSITSEFTDIEYNYNCYDSYDFRKRKTKRLIKLYPAFKEYNKYYSLYVNE